MESLTVLKEILVTKFDVEESLITPDATFESMDLDSLSQVELGTTLRKRLGVRITDAELQAVETLADIQRLLTTEH
ncbi:MAG TPA: acyl carrier protein [Kineosporiaceae bacterium]